MDIHVYVRRKVRIRTIRGLYCANLGSSLCVEIRRSRKQSQDGNVYCAHRGCATIQRSRTQTLDDSVALRTPCATSSNPPEGFLAMIQRAALRTRLCTTCATSSNLPLASGLLRPLAIELRTPLILYIHVLYAYWRPGSLPGLALAGLSSSPRLGYNPIRIHRMFSLGCPDCLASRLLSSHEGLLKVFTDIAVSRDCASAQV